MALLVVLSDEARRVDHAAVFLVIGVSTITLALTAAVTETGAPVTLQWKYALFAPAVMLVALGSRPHAHDRNRAVMSVLKSDLRNLAGAQDRYFAAHRRSATDLSALRFATSSGVTMTQVLTGPDWWTATNTHSQGEGVVCGIVINGKNPVVAEVMSGEPVCRERQPWTARVRLLLF